MELSQEQLAATEGRENHLVSSLKGFLIVCVVLGHFGQKLNSQMAGTAVAPWTGALVLFIYSFHMPLFVFVSGHLSKNAEKRRSLALAQLLIPYFIFQFLYAVPNFFFAPDGASFSLFKPFMGGWYLLALFVWRMLLPELKKVKFVLLWSLLASFLLPVFKDVGPELAMARVLGFAPFFLLGYGISGTELNDLRARIHPRIAVFLLAVFFGLLWWGISRFDFYNSALTAFCRKNNYENALAGIAGNLGAFACAVVAGFLVLAALPEKCAFLEHCGHDTMPTYISHIFVFCAFSVVANRLPSTIICFGCIVLTVLCVLMFSSRWYGSFFNRCLKWTVGLFTQV